MAIRDDLVNELIRKIYPRGAPDQSQIDALYNTPYVTQTTPDTVPPGVGGGPGPLKDFDPQKAPILPPPLPVIIPDKPPTAPPPPTEVPQDTQSRGFARGVNNVPTDVPVTNELGTPGGKAQGKSSVEVEQIPEVEILENEMTMQGRGATAPTQGAKGTLDEDPTDRSGVQPEGDADTFSSRFGTNVPVGVNQHGQPVFGDPTVEAVPFGNTGPQGNAIDASGFVPGGPTSYFGLGPGLGPQSSLQDFLQANPAAFAAYVAASKGGMGFEGAVQAAVAAAQGQGSFGGQPGGFGGGGGEGSSGGAGIPGEGGVAAGPQGPGGNNPSDAIVDVGPATQVSGFDAAYGAMAQASPDEDPAGYDGYDGYDDDDDDDS